VIAIIQECVAKQVLGEHSVESVAHHAKLGPGTTSAYATQTPVEPKLLITRRALNISQGGKWEFPGGKIEKGEQPFDALVREMKEELGIDVSAATHVMDIAGAITLMVYQVTAYAGVPRCCESQLAMRWVNVAELDLYEFPAPNADIIRRLRHLKSHQSE